MPHLGHVCSQQSRWCNHTCGASGIQPGWVRPHTHQAQVLQSLQVSGCAANVQLHEGRRRRRRRRCRVQTASHKDDPARPDAGSQRNEGAGGSSQAPNARNPPSKPSTEPQTNVHGSGNGDPASQSMQRAAAGDAQPALNAEAAAQESHGHPAAQERQPLGAQGAASHASSSASQGKDMSHHEHSSAHPAAKLHPAAGAASAQTPGCHAQPAAGGASAAAVDSDHPNLVCCCTACSCCTYSCGHCTPMPDAISIKQLLLLSEL